MSGPLFKDSEREKYERVWTYAKYRSQSDGMPAIDRAYSGMGCKDGETLIDWGCGNGDCAFRFIQYGLVVTGFDIAQNCLDYRFSDVPLVVGTIWDPPPKLKADYAFCTDVLEHIPPDYISQAVKAIAQRTRKAAFFQVDTVEDMSGPAMVPPTTLHLCVREVGWWQRLLKRYWRIEAVEPGEYTRWRFLCRKK